MLKNELFNPFYESGFRNSSLIVMRLWEKPPDSELGETTPPKHSTTGFSSGEGEEDTGDTIHKPVALLSFWKTRGLVL